MHKFDSRYLPDSLRPWHAEIGQDITDGTEVRPFAGQPNSSYRRAVVQGYVRSVGGTRYELTAEGAALIVDNLD